MKKLLVSVDLSKISNDIIQQATRLAKDLNAEIILAHIVSVDVGFVLGDLGFQYLPELEQTELKQDAVHLKEFEEAITKQGIKCESIVKQGVPAELLIEMADELDAYAIVLGSKGHGNLYNTLVGSVCHDIIKTSKKPVFVVPLKKLEE